MEPKKSLRRTCCQPSYFCTTGSDSKNHQIGFFGIGIAQIYGIPGSLKRTQTIAGESTIGKFVDIVNYQHNAARSLLCQLYKGFGERQVVTCWINVEKSFAVRSKRVVEAVFEISSHRNLLGPLSEFDIKGHAHRTPATQE